MNMIEKVARGLAWHNWSNNPDFDAGLTTIEAMYVEPKYFKLAKAAIQAMCEPSEGMKEAGSSYTGGELTPMRIGFAYQDMIDAALKE